MVPGPANQTAQRQGCCLAGQSLSCDRDVVCGTLYVTVPITWLRISSTRSQLPLYLFHRYLQYPPRSVRACWSPVQVAVAVLAQSPGHLQLPEPVPQRLPASQELLALVAASPGHLQLPEPVPQRLPASQELFAPA